MNFTLGLVIKMWMDFFFFFFKDRSYFSNKRVVRSTIIFREKSYLVLMFLSYLNLILEFLISIKWSLDFAQILNKYFCHFFPQNNSLSYLIEKCLVVHSHPTPIPPLPTWTNNIVKKNGSHYTLSTISYIIGPSR
jgi:hypothetical protein